MVKTVFKPECLIYSPVLPQTASLGYLSPQLVVCKVPQRCGSYVLLMFTALGIKTEAFRKINSKITIINPLHIKINIIFLFKRLFLKENQ